MRLPRVASDDDVRLRGANKSDTKHYVQMDLLKASAFRCSSFQLISMASAT